MSSRRPTSSLLKAVIRGAAFFAFMDVVAAAFSLAVHNYFTFGFALGVPIVAWDSLRRARRAERELDGTLWAPAKKAWTVRGRSWFLVTEAEPADTVESWD